MNDKFHMTFKDLQEDAAMWSQYNFGPQPTYRPLLGVMEEVGELAHAQLKREQNIRATPEEHDAQARDAVGDIVIYLADYCTKAGFSFQKCVEDAWEEVRQRDWRTYPKTGRPPTEA